MLRDTGFEVYSGFYQLTVICTCFYIKLCYIMIAGLPYLDSDLREFAGVFFKLFSNFKLWKDLSRCNTKEVDITTKATS